MNAYEIMVKTNHDLIQGEDILPEHRTHIVKQLLSARNTPCHDEKYYLNVKFTTYSKNPKRNLYPIFYTPSYNKGRKLYTILNQKSKTNILSMNLYELEILRLLYLFSPDDHEVNYMIRETLQRLKTTCFAYQDDGVGECFDTSLIVLRFLTTVRPDDLNWIQSRIDNYNAHKHEKKRPWYSKWYYWLCLSELPFELAKPEIDLYKEEMLHWLWNKSMVMNSRQDKSIHPVIMSILKNNIAKYPEYSYIKSRKPYINEKNGRLYFDMSL